MRAIALNLTETELELHARLRQLALACTLGAGIAALAAPAWAQSNSPTTSQPASGAGQTTQPAPQSGSGSAASPSQSTQTGQASQPGIRAVDAASLRLTFYTVRPADMLASKLIGLDVHNLQNEEVGEIEDLIVDEGKMIRGIVVGIGGFLGIGERHTAIDPGAILITREPGGSLKAVVNTTRDDLKKAPEFKFEGNMARSKSK